MRLTALTLLIFIIQNALGMKYDPQKEGEYYINYFKEQEVKNHIKESSLFKDCKAEATKSMAEGDYETRNKNILDCVQKKLDGASDQEISALGKALDSPNYKLLSNKDDKQIREYLEDRFAEAVYGDKNLKNNRFKQKVPGQDFYFKLYHSQVSKNFLSEVSGFCLQNIRVKHRSGFDFIEKALLEGANPQSLEYGEVTKDNRDQYKGKAEDIKKHLSETFKNQNVKAVMKQSFGLCLRGINKLCEKVEEKARAALPTTNPNNPPTTGNSSVSNFEAEEGKRSCIMAKSIRDYRTTLANYDAIYSQFQEIYKKDPNDPSYQVYLDRMYSWGTKAREKGIDQMVNISSNEVKQALNNKDVEKFKQLGCDKDPTKTECQVFVHGVDKQEQFEDIMVQTQAQTLLKLKKLEELKKEPSEFEKYLKENGYIEELKKYQEGGDQATQEAILKLLKEKHLAEEKSILATLREDYDAKGLKKKDVSQLNNGAASGEVHNQQVAKNVEKDLTEKQQKMKDMIQYANILSSFIGVTVSTPESGGEEEGKSKSKTKDKNLKAAKGGQTTERNLIGLKVEVDNQSEEDKELFQYLGSPQESSRSNNSNSTLSTNEIDNILSSFFTRNEFKTAQPPQPSN